MLGFWKRERPDPCNLLFLTGGTLENFRQPRIFINVIEALWLFLYPPPDSAFVPIQLSESLGIPS